MSSSTEPGPTQDTPRRRRSPLVVASVAAAVLLAGGGGAYLATSASDGGTARPAAEGTNPPPLVLDGHTEGSGIAPGEPDPRGVVYRAAGDLPDGPEAAPVYRAQGAVGADEVARLARALGVPGTPRLDGDAWKVAEKDGSGAVLQVGKEAPGTWTFGAAPTGDDCGKGTRCPAGGSASGGRPVGEDAAKRAAAPLLKALGQDAAKLDATQVMGSVRVVNADPVVGGLPTYGWSTGIQVGPDGRLVGGSGRLKEPVRGAEYPVIGAGEALKLLNAGSARDGRVGIGGCATPAPLEGEATERDVACDPERTPARETVTIGKAVFGLAAQFTQGRPALVPSWLFEVKPQGGALPFTITYPAVSPEHLAPVPTPKPTPTASRPELPDASGRQAESYRVDGSGRKLTVTFWAGVCSTYTAEAEESAAQVKVTVVESPPEPERYCIAIAEEQTVTVTLKAPLGDREVVDAATGGAVPRK
ncbi:hypothetical protein [Streptomyces sp. NRRL S-118]|uniref:hypothetical protein n=1 Tax=Streptomyces sp. NRRL S-118 TaxID=1463881 RepID=UPI0004CB1FCD|nr:hypothetical protein [Streptomyces sp. NRRL S-118]